MSKFIQITTKDGNSVVINTKDIKIIKDVYKRVPYKETQEVKRFLRNNITKTITKYRDEKDEGSIIEMHNMVTRFYRSPERLRTYKTNVRYEVNESKEEMLELLNDNNNDADK